MDYDCTVSDSEQDFVNQNHKVTLILLAIVQKKRKEKNKV